MDVCIIEISKVIGPEERLVALVCVYTIRPYRQGSVPKIP